MKPPKIKILVADDHPVSLGGLGHRLGFIAILVVRERRDSFPVVLKLFSRGSAVA
jgi:hypothetical protein